MSRSIEDRINIFLGKDYTPNLLLELKKQLPCPEKWLVLWQHGRLSYYDALIAIASELELVCRSIVSSCTV